jgi:transcriptional regulator with XRE-family HTH domain
MARRRNGVSTEYAQEIGARIVKARNELDGMTQMELADLLHVSQRSAQAYEAGEVIPYSRMSDIADILGVSQKWLLHGDDSGLGDAEIRRLLEKLIDTNTNILLQIQLLNEKVDRSYAANAS